MLLKKIAKQLLFISRMPKLSANLIALSSLSLSLTGILQELNVEDPRIVVLNCSSTCAQYPWVVSLTLLIFYFKLHWILKLIFHWINSFLHKCVQKPALLSDCQTKLSNFVIYVINLEIKIITFLKLKPIILLAPNSKES